MTISPYQNASLPVAERVEDLLARLNVEQKAGLMFHPMIANTGIDSSHKLFKIPSARENLDNGIRHMNLMGAFDTVREFCDLFNEIQRYALSQPVGIPVTLSSDPRNGFFELQGASMAPTVFSQWPEPIGMVALADPKRMEEQADIVRQEYVAVGFRMALHPQVDLSTEYRWSRIPGSYGEDGDLAAKLAKAAIRGLHGKTFNHESVATCVKHFPGGGPARHGYDPHFHFGSDAIYPGDNLEYHLKPFRAAVDAGTRFVMPSYAKPMGTKYEEVAMAYNKGIITDLLRNNLKFKGIVVSDWSILTSLPWSDYIGEAGEAKAWGVEDLNHEDRVVRALDAGIDQLGGEAGVDALIAVVRSGRVPESRLDESVRKILKEKFELGLFEYPYIDIEKAEATVGRADFVQAGLRAQRDSLTLLKNNHSVLPIRQPTTKIYVEGFKKTPTGLGEIVGSASDAEVAIVRLTSAAEVVGRGVVAASFPHGALEFPTGILTHITELAKSCPVVVDIRANRPPVLGSLVDAASAIIINYGVCEPALIEVLTGASSPRGKLPFDLPRSTAAVAASRADMPYDTKDPIYRWGHGLSY